MHPSALRGHPTSSTHLRRRRGRHPCRLRDLGERHRCQARQHLRSKPHFFGCHVGMWRAPRPAFSLPCLSFVSTEGAVTSYGLAEASSWTTCSTPSQWLGAKKPQHVPFGEGTSGLQEVQDEARPTFGVGMEDAESGIEPHGQSGRCASALSRRVHRFTRELIGSEEFRCDPGLTAERRPSNRRQLSGTRGASFATRSRAWCRPSLIGKEGNCIDDRLSVSSPTRSSTAASTSIRSTHSGRNSWYPC